MYVCGCWDETRVAYVGPVIAAQFVTAYDEMFEQEVVVALDLTWRCNRCQEKPVVNPAWVWPNK